MTIRCDANCNLTVGAYAQTDDRKAKCNADKKEEGSLVPLYTNILYE